MCVSSTEFRCLPEYREIDQKPNSNEEQLIN
jgi:hypothetical protein